MIEIYAIIEEEICVMEVNIDLKKTDEQVYDLCYQLTKKELNGSENFIILLIKTNFSYTRNISLKVESEDRFNKKQKEKILKDWIIEFKGIFGNFSNKDKDSRKVTDMFFDEYQLKIKHLEEDYNKLLTKYGIPTKNRFEEEIRKLYASI